MLNLLQYESVCCFKKSNSLKAKLLVLMAAGNEHGPMQIVEGIGKKAGGLGGLVFCWNQLL